MSLFKCREWWRAPACPGEEFDMGSLCVANLDNDPNGGVKIATGSLQGILRVYCPSSRGYQVDHQLLELQLDQAILQLAAGQFTVNHPGLTLAILHPRTVAIYSLTGIPSAPGGPATHHELKKLFEHTLEHSSANMCHGRFGNTQGLDALCVQSLDGQLSFYEGESPTFQRFLPNFLLPGPITYIPETDCIVTANSSFTIESYKFSVLAASSGEKPAETGSSANAGLAAVKKLQADWNYIIGENVVDMKTVRMSNEGEQQAMVLVLGEHTIYLLSETGQLRMQKRLDYPPASICVFGGITGAQNVMVGSSTANVLVYQGTQLVWMATCDEVPIAMAVSEFAGLQGLVVSLSETGTLMVSYMGTSPPLSVVGGFEGKELDYVAMDAEHRELLSAIRSATGTVRTEPADRLQLRAQVPTVLDNQSMDIGDGGIENNTVTARVYVSFIGKGGAKEISIAAAAPAPLQAFVTQSVVSNVSGGSRTPAIVPVSVSVGAGMMPAGNQITVTATYLKDGNNPRVAVCKFEVPMVLLCTAVPPVKNAEFKITIDTNRNPPPLPALFDDILAVSPAAAELARSPNGGNALSFQYRNTGQIVTILVSKNAGRYRLQSDHFEAMWIVVDELSRRLTAYYQGPGASAGGGVGPFSMSFSDQLPLQDYWTVIDSHFEARVRVLAIRKELSRKAQELRSIQKRMLVRFKDKSPAPMANMDTLMEATHGDIMALADQWEEEQAGLDAAAGALAGATQLMLLLIRFSFRLSPEADEILRAHLSPQVQDIAVPSSKDEHELEFHGWEEMTETAMTQLLRTCLARSAKESAAQVPPIAQISDTIKLKKHISLVLERLSKGGQLSTQ